MTTVAHARVLTRTCGLKSSEPVTCGRNCHARAAGSPFPAPGRDAFPYHESE